MPTTTIPLTARVVMKFQQSNREYQNVLHARKAGGWDATSLEALAEAAYDWWIDTYRTHSGNHLGLFEVVATDVSVEGGAQYTRPVSPISLGAVNEAPLPANVTATISWRTGRTGRRYRGRSYVVGITEPQVTNDDTMTGAKVTALTVQAQDWIAKMLGLSVQPVVASYTYGTAEPILSGVVENVVDSQRRRLPKRGR